MSFLEWELTKEAFLESEGRGCWCWGWTGDGGKEMVVEKGRLGKVEGPDKLDRAPAGTISTSISYRVCIYGELSSKERVSICKI